LRVSYLAKVPQGAGVLIVEVESVVEAFEESEKVILSLKINSSCIYYKNILVLDVVGVVVEVAKNKLSISKLLTQNVKIIFEWKV